MPPETAPPDLTIACYVRPALVLDPIDAKIETLRTLEDEGHVDALLLRSWPGEVALIEETPHPEVIGQYERFERWADRAGVDIDPAFQISEVSSLATDQTVDRLVTPSICLACYDANQLVGVFPHTDGETTHTVPEAIAALRTGSLPEPLRDAPTMATRSGDRSTTAADGGPSHTAPTALASSNCPDCERTMLNVQGILDCPGCAGYRNPTAPVPRQH